jgi:dolichol-phosphate mannosyltransferase
MPIAHKFLLIVVPLYDEAESLPRLNRELNKFLDVCGLDAGVLFVNDGSKDSSQEVIEKICRGDDRYHYLQLQQNSGLSAALKAGFDYCQSKWIGYIDADLQTSPMDFLELLKYTPQYDLVTGIRADRRDGFVKRISSRIANSVRRMLIHDGIKDTGCPLKIGRAEYIKQLPFFHGMHRFIPALVLMLGGRVKQLKVRHFPRMEGKPKFHLGNRLVGPLMDALAFRWMQNHYIRYKVAKEA